MNRKATLSLIFILMVLSFCLNIMLGSVNIPIKEIFKIFLNDFSRESSWAIIIFEFRIPKAITAVLAGSALAVSGLQMQTLFRNPLAGPFVLGISSGSSLGVAITVMLAQFLNIGILTKLGTLGSWGIVISASAGAVLVLVLVLLLSTKVSDSATILIIGLMFGSATSALVGIMKYFSDAELIKDFLIWTFGKLGDVTWSQMPIFIPVILLGLLLAFVLSKPLDALLLGEDYAKSMGHSVKRIRIMIVLSTGILAGCITAFCGPIAFIGIAVPHFTKSLIKIAEHKLLIPAVAIVGATLTLICDTIAQLPGSNEILPINSVTALFGAPFVIWVIIKRRKIIGLTS